MGAKPPALLYFLRQLPDQSPILGTTITLECLRKRGYEAMLSYYEKVASPGSCRKPLYTCLRFECPVDIRIEREERSSRTYSGVRGSPRQCLLAGQSTRLL